MSSRRLDEPLGVTDYFQALIDQLNGRLQEMCSQMEALWLVELFGAVSAGVRPYALRPELTRDGCHFNHAGYEVLGHTVSECLRELVEPEQLVLLMGDSITAGYPEYEPVLLGPEAGDETHSFGYYLRTLLDCRISNHGLSGDFTSNMIERMQEALDLEPDWVILQGGANDAFASLALGRGGLDRRRAMTEAQDICENFERMARMCVNHRIKVGVIPLLPFSAEEHFPAPY